MNEPIAVEFINLRTEQIQRELSGQVVFACGPAQDLVADQLPHLVPSVRAQLLKHCAKRVHMGILAVPSSLTEQRNRVVEIAKQLNSLKKTPSKKKRKKVSGQCNSIVD